MARVRCITEMGMGVDVHGKDATKASEWMQSNLKEPKFFVEHLYKDSAFAAADTLAVDAFPVAKVVEQPAQLLAGPGRTLLIHNASSPCGASESCRPAACAASADPPSGASVARPRRQPLCKEATRLRASSGLRAAGGGVPSAFAPRPAADGPSLKCGFRLAWRTRRTQRDRRRRR